MKLGDLQGALADYSQALQIDPSYVFAYDARAVVREERGDRKGALADYQQAAKLYEQRGDTGERYHYIRERIKALQKR